MQILPDPFPLIWVNGLVKYFISFVLLYSTHITALLLHTSTDIANPAIYLVLLLILFQWCTTALPYQSKLLSLLIP